MKLQELAAANPTKQIAKIFESYFGNRIDFDRLNTKQASGLLTRVRGLIKEHRRQPEFHYSEQNPAYLKLVMMEQALSSFCETAPVAAPQAPGAGQPNPQAVAMQLAQRRKQIQDQIQAKQAEIRELQQQLNMPAGGMAESRVRRLSESEVQQAQVVLAAQDMVDEVQKMSEQVSSMQFKDLPALVDQIKNQVGPDQANQFNTDATTALAGLLQNLQGARQQLDQALGVITGQAPVVPGEEVAPAPTDVNIDVNATDVDGETDLAADLEADVDAAAGDTNSLGRERR